MWRRTVGAILGGIAGFVLTGGNPIGVAAGAAIGGALASAADQAANTGTVDREQAAVDGAVDGAISLIGGAVAGKAIKLALPLQVADDGTTTFVHYTCKRRADAIRASGVIRPDGAGLGSSGGSVYGFPKEVPAYAKLLGLNTDEVIVVQVPGSEVTQNGLGHLLHRGTIILSEGYYMLEYVRFLGPVYVVTLGCCFGLLAFVVGPIFEFNELLGFVVLIAGILPSMYFASQAKLRLKPLIWKWRRKSDSGNSNGE